MKQNSRKFACRKCKKLPKLGFTPLDTPNDRNLRLPRIFIIVKDEFFMSEITKIHANYF